MASVSKKRTLESFFAPSTSIPKKPRFEDEDNAPSTRHRAYPFAVPQLPPTVGDLLDSLPSSVGREINDQPHLDLLYFQPFFPKKVERILFEFLRGELFWYRVEYSAKKFGKEFKVNTPRWTTVFGLDQTSQFDERGEVVDAQTKTTVSSQRYPTCRPRPIPECLDKIRQATERATGDSFNICLVNYYASGSDSISFHSDDERFLGPNPSIASFSLGARRDFLLKHKPRENEKRDKTLKYPLDSGDMILMRGTTQSNWLHSIPKRSGVGTDSGRINITFRKAMVRGGTENYYQYNVGGGPVFKWDPSSREMKPWTSAS